MSKFCIHCGMENADQAVVCTRCNGSLVDAVPAEPPPTGSHREAGFTTKFCVHCGKENAGQAVVCTRCHNSLADAVPAEPPPTGSHREAEFTTKFCVHCGKENAGQAVVCTRCSNSLADAVPAELPPNQSSGDVASSYLPVILGSLVLILYLFPWVQVGSYGSDDVFGSFSGVEMSRQLWTANGHGHGRVLYFVPVYVMAVMAHFLLLPKNKTAAECFEIITWCGAGLVTVILVDLRVHTGQYVSVFGPVTETRIGFWLVVELAMVIATAVSVHKLKLVPKKNR